MKQHNAETKMKHLQLRSLAKGVTNLNFVKHMRKISVTYIYKEE